jgi:hypothetical protein
MSRRTYNAFLCLGQVKQTALRLLTTSSLTLSFLSRLFFNTLRLYFYKVLVAYNLCLS